MCVANAFWCLYHGGQFSLVFPSGSSSLLLLLLLLPLCGGFSLAKCSMVMQRHQHHSWTYSILGEKAKRFHALDKKNTHTKRTHVTNKTTKSPLSCSACVCIHDCLKWPQRPIYWYTYNITALTYANLFKNKKKSKRWTKKMTNKGTEASHCILLAVFRFILQQLFCVIRAVSCGQSAT